MTYGLVCAPSDPATEVLTLGVTQVTNKLNFVNSLEFSPGSYAGGDFTLSYDAISDELVSVWTEFGTGPATSPWVYPNASGVASAFYPQLTDFTYLNAIVVKVESGATSAGCRINNFSNGNTRYAPSSLFAPAGQDSSYVFFLQDLHPSFNISGSWDPVLNCECYLYIYLGRSETCLATAAPVTVEPAAANYTPFIVAISILGAMLVLMLALVAAIFISQNSKVRRARR